MQSSRNIAQKSQTAIILESPITSQSIAQVLVPFWLVTSLSVVIVVIRMYVRLQLINAFGVDDWMILCATLCAVVGVVACTALLFVEDTNLSYLGVDQASIVVYAMTDFFVRLSLLVSYLRLTPRSCKNHRRAIRFFIVWVVLMAVFAVVMTIAPCWPPHLLSFENYYKAKLANDLQGWHYRCWRPGNLVLLVGTLGVFSNILIFAFPFFLLRKASINKDQRRTLYALFAFGGVVILLGIVRVPFLAAYSTDNEVTIISLTGLAAIATLLAAEANCMIWSACLPTLQPIIRRLRNEPRSSQRFTTDFEVGMGHVDRSRERYGSQALHSTDTSDPDNATKVVTTSELTTSPP